MSQMLRETPEWAKTLDPMGRPCKYDWNEWLDGQQHLLVRSTAEYPDGDYDTETRFFRHTVLRAAERLGVEVDIVWKSGRNFEDKRDRMIVQAQIPSAPAVKEQPEIFLVDAEDAKALRRGVICSDPAPLALGGIRKNF